MEPRHVDSLADSLDELVTRRVSARHRQVEWKRPEPLGGRRERMTGRSSSIRFRALRGATIPDDVLGNAALDDHDRLFRHALEVERLRQAVGREAVVDEREGLVEDLLADPAREVAAVLEEGESVQRAEAEVPEELGEGVRLEHCPVRAGLELDRALRARRLLGGLPRDGRRIE